MTLAKWFWAVCPPSPSAKKLPGLLKTIVNIGFWRISLLLEFNMITVSSRHAVVGVRVPQSQRAASAEDSPVCLKIRRLSPADGRRGRQELNCVSGKFVSFINQSFQF